MSISIEIQLIACLVAVSCVLPGIFLVLRKMALITDAISHAILPGIVLGFFITHDIKSPILILMAAASGILMVLLVGAIQKTALVKEDTAIGLVFPMLFSIGVILISQYANNIHLDTDAVLLGELAFAPLDRFYWKGIDLGARSIWVMGCIFIVNLSFVVLFFKELKLSTFDKELATTLGFSPILIHYGLMSIASITTVGAFDSVGAILVISFMITPSATAYLLCTDLKKMILTAMGIACIGTSMGYWVSKFYNTSIAGSITVVLALIFLGVYLVRHSILVHYKQEQQKQAEIFLITLLLHLGNHTQKEEHTIPHLRAHFKWTEKQIQKTLALGNNNNFIVIENQHITLTEKGKNFTKQTLQYVTKEGLSNETDLEKLKENFFLFRG